MNGVTSKNYFATLTIIYFALMMAMLFFSGVVMFAGIQQNDPELAEIFMFVVPAMVVVCYGASHFAYRLSLQRINKTDQLAAKLRHYQGAVLVRAAPVEAAGLFGAVATLVTGNDYFLIAPAFSILVFMLQRPTIFAAVEDLSLSSDEKMKLENPNEIVADRPSTNP